MTLIPRQQMRVLVGLLVQPLVAAATAFILFPALDRTAAAAGVYQGRTATATEFARTHGAELAGKRRVTRYSLAPACYLDVERGFRCVLPSPNGAQVTIAAAAAAPIVLAGSLRNARAVAAAASRLGNTFNVIPAGERWRDGSLRPALEDWIGAGAILRWLPGSRSPEADAAVAAFERYRDCLVDTLDRCGSGRELEERGHARDKDLAGALDVSDCVPRFDGVAYEKVGLDLPPEGGSH